MVALVAYGAAFVAGLLFNLLSPHLVKNVNMPNILALVTFSNSLVQKVVPAIIRPRSEDSPFPPPIPSPSFQVPHMSLISPPLQTPPPLDPFLAGQPNFQSQPHAFAHVLADLILLVLCFVVVYLFVHCIPQGPHYRLDHVYDIDAIIGLTDESSPVPHTNSSFTPISTDLVHPSSRTTDNASNSLDPIPTANTAIIPLSSDSATTDILAVQHVQDACARHLAHQGEMPIAPSGPRGTMMAAIDHALPVVVSSDVDGTSESHAERDTASDAFEDCDLGGDGLLSEPEGCSSIRYTFDSDMSLETLLDRQFPHMSLSDNYCDNETQLLSVLHSLHHLCPDCGHMAGMGEMAVDLLRNNTPSAVYETLARTHSMLEEHTSCNPGCPAESESSFVLERMVERLFPEIYYRMSRKNILFPYLTREWFLFQMQHRLMDIFFGDGRDMVVIIGLGIFGTFKEYFMDPSTTAEAIMLFFPFILDADIVKDWVNNALRDEKLRADIQSLRQEWRQTNREYGRTFRYWQTDMLEAGGKARRCH